MTSLVQRYKKLDSIQRFGVGLLMAAAILAIVGYAIEYRVMSLGEVINRIMLDFYANISSEMVGIAVTILVIDRMNRQRDKTERQQRDLERRLEEKKRLIRQMKNHDSAIAVQAVQEIRAQGWHDDGSLSGTDLHEANLQNADLSRAMLNGSSLTKVNLRGANLERTNLQNAILSSADLREADLDKANMQKALLVEANLTDASMEKTDLSGAQLGLAILRGALLRRAILAGADLNEADLRDAALEVADFSRETTLPDGSKWSPNVDVTRFTNPRHPEFWRSDNPASPAYEQGEPSTPTKSEPKIQFMD